jgi:FeS assembly SUF system regulator
MIRITRQTDYGILLLSRMAGAPPGTIHTVRDLAGGSGISMPMASKILKPLAREGILDSHRGIKGGYSLARPAEEITVREIIEVLEGPLRITTCVSNPGSCEQEETCTARGNWERINRTVRDALDRIPLSEMATGAPYPGHSPAPEPIHIEPAPATGCREDLS